MSSQEVRINVAPKVELHTERDKLLTSPPQEQADDRINEHFKKLLYKAALKDDWRTAYKDVFKGDPLKNSKYLTATISEKLDTALHIAVAAESSIFAKKLVNFVQKDDLAIKNCDGNTAFFLAASSGRMGLAKMMVEKNEKLPDIRGVEDEETLLPIHVAAKHGHEKMMEFLLGVTKDITEKDMKKLQDLTQRKDLFGFTQKLTTKEGRDDSALEIELHEKKDEHVINPPREEFVFTQKLTTKEGRDDSALEIELHEKKDEHMINPPREESGSSEEKAEIETSRSQDITDEIRKKLYKAALRNEWYTDYWSIFETDREIISKYATTVISENDDIALHIAAEAGSLRFISKLLTYMSEKQLERPNSDGNTAFYLAAKCGRWKCAKAMFNKNINLPNIGGDDGMLPIHTVAQQGHIETVKFLYGVSEHELTQEDCKDLLPHLISRADLFDVAWALLEKDPSLVADNISNGRTGKGTFLHVLARTHLMSHDLSNQNQEGFFKRFFNKFSDKNKLPHEKLPKEALGLLKLLLEEVDCREDWVHGVIHVAVEHENIEFLSLIIRDYPEFMSCKRGDTITSGLVFSTILKRHKNISKLLKDIRPSFKKKILEYKDDKDNNILHLAGKLSPPEQLDAICGVALQLQQELMWFEEMSNTVGPSKAHAKNTMRETPKALFDREHKQLKENGEQWMKDTANSCMIVATLIATVVFAAAFIVPGGTNEESGIPRFANNLSFRIFVLADTISLVLSVYSLLIFLAIHTSRYAKKDFLLELPKKLVLGLLTLLLSIAAMMVVFCTTIFIVFKVEKIWVRILLCVCAALPVIHFAKIKWRLLFDVVRSTYKMGSILDDKGRKKEA